MASIPLHRVAVVLPFTQFLSDVGMPVERGFQRAGLPICALDDVNNYVPSNRFWTFLVDTAHRQSIADLGFRVGQTFGADSGDPKLTERLRQSPTLYLGFVKASKFINKSVSHCRVGILNNARGEHAYLYHRPSCDARNPAIEQIGWFGIMFLIGMVRVFVGPKWQPSEIGVMTNHPPGRNIREQFPNTRIRLSQRCSYIALEKALLSLPPFGGEAAPASSLFDCEPLEKNLAGSLEQVLRSYIEERDLSIEFAAELSNMSKRSLQRKLKETGTRYSEVLDQVHFHAACRMLKDLNMQVTDISNCLGYSASTHFSRAFRRIAGVNPQQYRQAYLQNCSKNAPVKDYLGDLSHRGF